MALSGTYQMTADSPVGKLEGIVTLTAVGDMLTGTMTGMGSTVVIENGKAMGDAFEFDARIPAPLFGTMKITAHGMVNGDTISGHYNTSFGSMPFQGTRIG